MSAKITRVTLVAGNLTREFPIDQAERILRLRNGGGWALPEDSEFIYTNENGITNRPNKAKPKGTKKRKRTKKSNSASAESQVPCDSNAESEQQCSNE